MLDADKVKRATETFVYGFPLVCNLDELAKFPAGEASALGREVLPYNQFGKARDLLDPTVKFVSPNNDTLYLVVVADLWHGPLVLHVPDTHDRYYVLQFVDAWTNNFAYVGRRATGTKEADFLLTPAGYGGAVPDHMQVIEAPSRLFVIVGRIQVDGTEDLPAVHALQDQFQITPLSAQKHRPFEAPPAGIPQPNPAVSDDLAFWEKFRVELADFPPPAADKAFVEAAAELGVTSLESPYVEPDRQLADLLAEAEKLGRALIEDLSTKLIKMVNGWASAMHSFDYNLDRCGPGTFDTPEWKITDRTMAYVTRAVAARMGLWGNHGYEADYKMLWQDEHVLHLDGERSIAVEAKSRGAVPYRVAVDGIRHQVVVGRVVHGERPEGSHWRRRRQGQLVCVRAIQELAVTRRGRTRSPIGCHRPRGGSAPHCAPTSQLKRYWTGTTSCQQFVAHGDRNHQSTGTVHGPLLSALKGISGGAVHHLSLSARVRRPLNIC